MVPRETTPGIRHHLVDVRNNSSLALIVSAESKSKLEPQPPKAEKQGRPCAYCKDDGCHIKRCDKLAEKNRQ